MFYTSNLPYKNLILQTLLSLTTTLLLSLLSLPTLFLLNLHTYIHPENLSSSSSSTAAIRPPSSSAPLPKKHRSKFEFDETNAQIFRLHLVDDQIRSRLFFSDYKNLFLYSSVTFSNLMLHLFLSPPDSAHDSPGILASGSVIPTVFALVTVTKSVTVIAKLAFEKSASKRSDKLLSVILGFVGFLLAFLIVFEVSKPVFDFEFGQVDGVAKFSVALFSGCLAGFLYMPALKSARSFWLGTDQLRWNLSIISCGWIARMLLYANYVVVVFTSLLWINPIAELFVKAESNSVRLVGNVGMGKADFMKVRIWCLLASGLVQILTLRPNLQMFLNEAVLSWYQRLHSSKVPDLAFSRAKIFLHNYYLCLGVLQFFIPPVLVLVFLGLSRIEGNFIVTFPSVCSFVPCSAFVKDVALFMSWWVVFVWSVFTSLTLLLYRFGILYVS